MNKEILPKDNFSIIHKDLFFMILDKLSFGDRVALSATSRRLRALVELHPMWKHLVSQVEVKPNNKLSDRKLFLVEFNKNYPTALVAVGELYRRGMWMPRDLPRACDYYEKAMLWNPPIWEKLWYSESLERVEKAKGFAANTWFYLYNLDGTKRSQRKFDAIEICVTRLLKKQTPADLLWPIILRSIKTKTDPYDPLKSAVFASSLQGDARAQAVVFVARMAIRAVDPALDAELYQALVDPSVPEVTKEYVKRYIEWRAICTAPSSILAASLEDKG